MIRHIVLWRLKDSIPGLTKIEAAATIKHVLEDLNGKIPGLIRLEVGFDFSLSEESSDVVLYSEFESREALDAYQIHPLHKAVMPVIKELRSERRLVDCEI